MKQQPNISTAYHEAGHAAMSWMHGASINRVTIDSDANALGKCVGSIFRKRDWEQFHIGMTNALRIKVEKEIMIQLAGPIAQRLYKPQSYRSYHARGDHQNAVDFAFRLFSSTAQIEAYLKFLDVLTRERLQADWIVVEAIATALVQQRTIRGADVHRLVSDVIKKESTRRTYGTTKAI